MDSGRLLENDNFFIFKSQSPFWEHGIHFMPCQSASGTPWDRVRLYLWSTFCNYEGRDIQQMKAGCFSFSLLPKGLQGKGVKLLQFWWLEMMVNSTFSGALQTCKDIAVSVMCALQEGFLSVCIQWGWFSAFISTLKNLRHKEENCSHRCSNEGATCCGKCLCKSWGASRREWQF